MFVALCSPGCRASTVSTASEGPDISLHGLLSRDVAETPAIHVNIGGRRLTVHLESPGRRLGLTIEAQGPRYGDVPVRVVLVSTEGDSLAGVEFIQRFQRSHNHWVSAFVGPERPVGFCMGTVETAALPATAFPGSGGVRDTLFIMHGRIPKGAVC